MHDQFIRAILSDKNIATDYFQHFLPPAISSHLDFSTLTHLPDSYLSDDLQKSMSDIVYTCSRNDSAGQLKISLLIEHKSYPDKYTPIQIGSYIFSALQKQIANKEPLSMVVPVLLYHGRGKWKYKTVAQLFNNLPPEWRQYIPDFSYIYNNLGQVPDEQVEALKNKFLVASLLALKHAFEKDWLEQNALRILVLSEEAPGSQLHKQLLMYYFTRSELEEGVIFKLLESVSTNNKDTIMSTADYFIEKGKKEGKEEGKEEGIKIGRVQGEERRSRLSVQKMLSANKLSIAEIADYANVTEAFVLQVKEQMQQL